MLAIIFFVAGLYMVFKKEIKVSSKKSIKGKTAQVIGLVFISPALLSYAIRLLPEGRVGDALSLISLASYAVAFITIVYFVFFRKTQTEEQA